MFWAEKRCQWCFYRKLHLQICESNLMVVIWMIVAVRIYCGGWFKLIRPHSPVSHLNLKLTIIIFPVALSVTVQKLNQLIAVEKDKIEGRSEPSILDPLFKSNPNRTPGGIPSTEGSVLRAFNNASDYLDNSLDQTITLVKDALQIGKKWWDLCMNYLISNLCAFLTIPSPQKSKVFTFFCMYSSKEECICEIYIKLITMFSSKWIRLCAYCSYIHVSKTQGEVRSM